MSETTIEITEAPKADVSVIITCKDLEQYLGDAVESVWSQTIHPGEVIIIHDGCKAPQMYKGTHTVIRENNLGVAKSRDEGVRISVGNHLLFLDADDVMPETYIQEMISTLQKGADIAYPNNLLWSRWGDSTFPNVWHGAPPKLTFREMLRMNRVVVSSLMKRGVYCKIGGFDPTMEIYEDWQFFLEAMVKGFKFGLANTYLKYRQRTQSRNHQKDEVKKKVHALVNSRYYPYLLKQKKRKKTYAKK